MAEGLVFTFYTYADARIPREERWKPTGLRDMFFDNYDDVKSAVLAMREDIAADPDMEWETTNIEKVEGPDFSVQRLGVVERWTWCVCRPLRGAGDDRAKARKLIFARVAAPIFMHSCRLPVRANYPV
ncbi:hypothetical protein [Agrobacterium pusense]|uniref:hypothetical protein n=1 Tax=Agrobacterium pusense TaxID=648995 RepID=UPI0026B8CDFF